MSFAGKLRAGDRYLWAGRVVTVVQTDPDRSWHGRRTGVYVTVESDDVPRRRLHYWVDEEVQRA